MKFVKSVSLVNPNTGKARTYVAGEDVPEWGEDACSAEVFAMVTGGEAPAADDGNDDGAPDPSKMTVDEIEAHVAKNPKHAAEMLKAEQAGKDRSTAVEALEAAID